MNKNTMNAIQKHIINGEYHFYLGKNYYECDINNIIRRREQQPSRTPTSDWEQVGSWNPHTGEIEQLERR